MHTHIKKIFTLISEKLGVAPISRMIEMDRRLAIADYLQKHLFTNTKYTDSPRLNKYERTIYSQGGDDGIITEIFKRIGTTDSYFLEFGVGDGTQNNTVALLLQNWKGFWIEGNNTYFNKIQKNLRQYIDSKKLQVVESFITAENIEKIFTQNYVPKEFDFLSIDIDGNDYWIWNAITNYSPRVVVLEYNAAYGPEINFIPTYSPDYVWKRTNFYGSSLSALTKLATEKGYSLVACSFLGNNVYFVRNDCLGNKFDTQLHNPIFAYEDHKAFLLQNSKYPVTLENGKSE